MKGILPKSRFAFLANNVATTSGPNRLCTEIDTGGAQNGSLAIVFEYTSHALTNVDIWTSRYSDFSSDGTANAASGDDTKQIVITSDDSNLYANIYKSGANPSDVYPCTVASNVITTFGNADQMVVVNVKDCKRYLNVQYDAAGTNGKLTVVFIGHDMDKTGYPGARSAY